MVRLYVRRMNISGLGLGLGLGLGRQLLSTVQI